MSKIQEITAREIKDSRGKSTVEVEVITEKGSFVASCPWEASATQNEAVELREADLPVQAGGKGVALAVHNVNTVIAPKLKGKEVIYQQELDELIINLDGTGNKSTLGANAILPVSMAICRAGAAAKKLPLYQYIGELIYAERSTEFPNFPGAMFNFIEARTHANNQLNLQEFMVVPDKELFSENLAIANKVFTNLQEIIHKNYGRVIMGDEGGFAPPITTTEQALFLLKNAIDGSDNVGIAIDAAASQFYQDGKYILGGREFSRQQLLEFYIDLLNRFRSDKNFPLIMSIEDPFAKEDWEGFKMMYNNFKEQDSNVRIVGDELTCTDIQRIKKAIHNNCISAVIIKPNQIGTVWGTLEAIKLAQDNGLWVIVSHQSGETMDTFIADLAVGVKADYIKAGSPAQPERMAKYNRLLEIEHELGKK
jgi:enolase